MAESGTQSQQQQQRAAAPCQRGIADVPRQRQRQHDRAHQRAVEERGVRAFVEQLAGEYLIERVGTAR